jgi:signal transduction histidine kinase/CheY-like chemotaxis protein
VSPIALRDSIRRRISGVRQLLAVEIADPTGHVQLGTRTEAGTMLPPAGLVLLAQHQADPKLGMLFSEPVHQDDGSWTALVTRRIDGADQHFEGLAVGWLNLGYFEDFYRSVELTENGAISLHRRDGMVLARYPHDEQAYGTSYGDLPPFRDVLAHAKAGTVAMETPPDQSRRILAIRALGSVPLAVNVSVDEASVLAGWRRQTWIFAFAALGSGLVMAGLMFQLARRSREMQAVLDVSVEAHANAEAANARLIVQMDERERAEAALRQSQRAEALGQLTGGVAHDFNNLLTVLLGNIELMQSNPLASPFLTRLASMRSAAERGAKLTTHLLAFARRQQMVPRPVNLACLVRGMEPLLASALGMRITIVLDLDETAPLTQVDGTQIELMILNIAMNARDAMPGGGTMHIETRVETIGQAAPHDAPAPGSYLRLRIRDTGTGMPPNVLHRAFEPYFTTKLQNTGSGLGLSQVYGTAQQSGGMAKIESSLGVGTTVTVLLPCGSRSADQEPPHVASPFVQRGRGTILIVDDDKPVRTTTAMLLRRANFTVVEASDADEALAALAHDATIELLISDVVMPKTNGTELARLAAGIRPELPVLFVSGYADPQAIASAIPASNLLRKPFRPVELITLIERTLAESRKAQALPA